MSRIRVHISAEPALVIGITLMSLAVGTFLALVVVKSASISTFHFVESQVKD